MDLINPIVMFVALIIGAGIAAFFYPFERNHQQHLIAQIQ